MGRFSNSISSFFNRFRPESIGSTRRNIGMSGGTLVTPDTAMQASAFYRGVIYISSQIAKLPWEVKDAQNKVLVDNNVFYLLNVAPNEEMSSFHLKMYLIQCAIIEGNGYAEIERTLDGRPVALWPLNPRRVDPYRTEDGKLWYRITDGGRNGETILVSPKDLFIVRNLHTKDAIQGQGIVGYAMETLGISLGADKFANALFTNGGIPSGTLEHPAKMSDEAYARLIGSWKEQYGGRKTGGTALLEEGVKYNPVSLAPDVLQFLESRQFNVLEMARFLGIPPTKLFDSHSAKFNNIEHANLEVATDTLDSWARNLESEADIKLLAGRKGGRRTELDLYAVFRGDMVTRSTYFKNMMSTGAMTPNEIRQKEGWSGYKGGDRYYIATNNFTPADRMDELLDSQIKSKEPESLPPPSQDSTSKVDDALIKYLDKKSQDKDLN